MRPSIWFAPSTIRTQFPTWKPFWINMSKKAVRLLSSDQAANKATPSIANNDEPKTNSPRSSIPQNISTKHSTTNASIIFNNSSALNLRWTSTFPFMVFSSNFLVTFNKRGKSKMAIRVTINLYCVPIISKSANNSKVWSRTVFRKI